MYAEARGNKNEVARCGTRLKLSTDLTGEFRAFDRDFRPSPTLVDPAYQITLLTMPKRRADTALEETSYADSPSSKRSRFGDDDEYTNGNANGRISSATPSAP